MTGLTSSPNERAMKRSSAEWEMSQVITITEEKV